MIHFGYTVSAAEKFIKKWSRFLKVKSPNSLLSFPDTFGTGYIYGKDMNSAMSFLVMNLKLNEQLLMDRRPLDETGFILYFIQINYGGHCVISTDIDKAEFGQNVKQRCIFLTSPNYPLQMNYSKDTELKLLGVYFKSSLLRRFLKKDIFYHLQEESQARLEGLDKRSITSQEDRLLREIFNANLDNKFGRFVLYNRVLLLIENTLNRFLLNELPESKTSRLKEKDMDGLKEVEALLSETELEKFPSVNELARIALMSSTKLKKRFKEVYGMKLYEFYNYNRLLKARQWIERGETSVKEASFRLGFSNRSNFSKAFKKEFGILPNQIKPQ
jgi:AraC-like DNA-binding protein